MSGLLDYFDRIYVINLATRTDRKREMEEQFARINLSFEHPRVSLFAAIRPKDPGGFPSIGARGCFLSHLEILRDAQRNDVNRILIFEDDLDLVLDFAERSPRIVDALGTRKWSLFYGGYEIDTALATTDANDLSIIASGQGVRTTHFLGVQKPAIGRLVVFLEILLTRPAGDPNGGPMHVDGAYNWYRRLNPQDVTLAAVPELGRQRSSRTDVHDLRWYDRLPLVRVAVARLRRIKNTIHS